MILSVYMNRSVVPAAYAAGATVSKRKSKGCRAFVISEKNQEHIVY